MSVVVPPKSTKRAPRKTFEARDTDEKERLLPDKLADGATPPSSQQKRCPALCRALIGVFSSYFVVAYAIFLSVAAVAVAEGADLDEWISLVTNGALGVTGFYAYKMRRYDLATAAAFGMCTSVVWHSSGKFKQIDGFVSRYIAYYAFGTAAFPPAVIGPGVLFLAVLVTYEPTVAETYAYIPLLVIVAACRLKTITWRFVGALVVGVCALQCYGNAVWHSMWHVLGAIAVALTIEPPKRQPRLSYSSTPE